MDGGRKTPYQAGYVDGFDGHPRLYGHNKLPYFNLLLQSRYDDGYIQGRLDHLQGKTRSWRTEIKTPKQTRTKVPRPPKKLTPKQIRESD